MLQKCFANVEKSRLLFPRKDETPFEIIRTGLRSEFRHFFYAAEHVVGIYLVCKCGGDEVRRAVWLKGTPVAVLGVVCPSAPRTAPSGECRALSRL